MNDVSHVHLKATPAPPEIERFELKSSAVAPFPRAKFLLFLKQLKVQSKDYGLVPFRLLGSQIYLLDEICSALDNGITVIYVLKNRQAGISTFLLALDLFWAFIDTIGGSLLKEWQMTEDLKRMAINQLKNGIELGRVIPRSIPLIDEMRRIVNDEGHIGGEGRSKDDRVVVAALAYQAWNVWTQPRVKALGLTTHGRWRSIKGVEPSRWIG